MAPVGLRGARPGLLMGIPPCFTSKLPPIVLKNVRSVIEIRCFTLYLDSRPTLVYILEKVRAYASLP